MANEERIAVLEVQVLQLENAVATILDALFAVHALSSVEIEKCDGERASLDEMVRILGLIAS